MLPFRCFLLTFHLFFCRIKVYKGKFRRIALCGCCMLLLCSGCRRKETPTPTPPPSPSHSPSLVTKTKGVWLSYIELDEMLDTTDSDAAAAAIRQAVEVCADQGLNTIFFHLRAHGDAYYPSAVWPPASSAERVIQGGFDPLACAIQEAHQRGISLHAWINPYRLGASPIDGLPCFEKGGVWYLRPDSPTARQTVLEGIREILTNYDVDGVHFDDYFYPAGMAAEGEPFEDIPPHTDPILWRQTQVDTLVSGVYGLCHQHGKPFGVSPMADVQRCRTEACADVTRWMTEAGYIDYVCPQLYVGFRHQTKPFLTLLDQWTALDRREDIDLYIGLALYKVGLTHDPYAGTGADEWVSDPNIIPRQMEAAQDVADGWVLFRHGNLT